MRTPWKLTVLATALVLASASNAPGADDTAVDMEDTSGSNVPDDEKGGAARAAVTRMQTILTAVLKHLSDARDGGDVVKVNCVNEKLTAVKGLVKVSEDAAVRLQEALARRDGDIAAHEFEKVTIALNKCEQVLAESESCMGELALAAGETELEVEEDEAITQATDPSEVAAEPPPPVDPPPTVSPFL